MAPAFLGIMPLTTTFIHMITSADVTGQVNANDVVSVELFWMRSHVAAMEPIAIWTTNGAAVVPGSITDASDIVQDDGVIRFRTPAIQNGLNIISFDVTAPRNADEFTLSVKVGNENATNTPQNFKELTFGVIRGTNIRTFANLADIPYGDTLCYVEGYELPYIRGTMPFYVFVETIFDSSAGYRAFITIINEETNAAANITGDFNVALDTDGSATFRVNFGCPDDEPEGIYLVHVEIREPVPPPLPFLPPMLWPIDGSDSETRIRLYWPEPSITLYSSGDVVDVGENFEIYGYVFNVDSPHMVSLKVFDSDGNEIDVAGLHTSTEFINGRFSFGNINFTSGHPDGRYYVEVILLNSDNQQLAIGRIPIQLARPIPSTITVTAPATVADNGTFAISGSFTTSYANPRVFWEILNAGGTEIRSGEATLSGNTFEVPGLSFAANAPTGTYTINVFLRNTGGDTLATATRTIQLTVALPTGSITVSSPTANLDSAPLSFNGTFTTSYANPRIDWEVRNPSGTVIINGNNLIPSASAFAVNNLSFTRDHPSGTWTIHVFLRTSDGREIARNSSSFMRTRHGTFTIRSSVSNQTVNPANGFTMSGTVTYPTNLAGREMRVRWRVERVDGGSRITVGSGTAIVNANGTFSIPTMSFPRPSTMNSVDIRAWLYDDLNHPGQNIGVAFDWFLTPF